MPRKRSRLETIHDILELARNEILKTHIMYRANMSHDQLNKYLEILLTRQLLKVEKSIYMTTARGRDFLKTFHAIQEILDELPQIHVAS